MKTTEDSQKKSKDSETNKSSRKKQEQATVAQTRARPKIKTGNSFCRTVTS